MSILHTPHRPAWQELRYARDGSNSPDIYSSAWSTLHIGSWGTENRCKYDSPGLSGSSRQMLSWHFFSLICRNTLLL
jgi:hypothetical protein